MRDVATSASQDKENAVASIHPEALKKLVPIYLAEHLCLSSIETSPTELVSTWCVSLPHASSCLLTSGLLQPWAIDSCRNSLQGPSFRCPTRQNKKSMQGLQTSRPHLDSSTSSGAATAILEKCSRSSSKKTRKRRESRNSHHVSCFKQATYTESVNQQSSHLSTAPSGKYQKSRFQANKGDRETHARSMRSSGPLKVKLQP